MQPPLRSLNMKYCSGRLCTRTLGRCHWPVLPQGWREGVGGSGYHCHLVHRWPELWPGEKLKRCFSVNIGLALFVTPADWQSSSASSGIQLRLPAFAARGWWPGWNERALSALALLPLEVAQSKFHLANLEEVKCSPLSGLIKSALRWMIFSKDLICHLSGFSLSLWAGWLYS